MLQGPEGGGFGARVAIVELEGIIVDVEELLKDLKGHRDNPLVRAVVIRINSPGGIVGPTQELHDAIRRVRQAGKPVVASLGAVAASGGYYVAVAADQIYANPGTLTGSIGVIMQMANLENLMKKVGVEYVVIKSGQFKDVGNISRPMTAEERRVLQALLDDVHRQFIDAVAQGRHLDRARVVGFADGRVFSGAQAKTLGMVDELGGLPSEAKPSMTKAELIDEVSKVSNLTKKETETIVNTIFDNITDALAKGDKVELRGFGSFRIRHRNSRKGRNPKTGSNVDVPQKRVPFFKVGKRLRELVNT